MPRMDKNKIHYCPVGLIQRQFGIYVTGAGMEETKPGEPYPHAYHSSDYYFTWRKGRALTDWEYQILYIRSGTGEIEFERGKSIAIGAGSVIILHPNEWHRYRPNPKTGWREAYIGIGGNFLERIFAKPFFSGPPTIVKVPPEGKFDKEIAELVAEIQDTSAEQPYAVALKTMQLVVSLFMEHPNQTGRTSYNVAIRRANLYIAHHLGEVVDFEALAKRCGMGYTLFRKRFREYNGMSPLEYQIALRIRRAMHLLESTDLPIARIAEETGFESHAYFSRLFHARVGTPPIQFRLAHAT